MSKNLTGPSLSILPSVNRIIQLVSREGELKLSHQKLKQLSQEAIDCLRQLLLKGKIELESRDSAEDWVKSKLFELYYRDRRRELNRVINATGIIVHTNLGRAPLAERALERVRELSTNYSTLEYDLEERRRGKRSSFLLPLLRELTGAEYGFAVNNNASAVLLVLKALADGKEVIISRGELVEIGGSFRIPDVMAQSGALLREVGTTNRTHLEDYRRAIGPNTGAILKVHCSNYRISGFTAEVSIEELAELARDFGIPLIVDLGSGLLYSELLERLPHPFRYPDGKLALEPSVRRAIELGADIATWSGDKLLGGPQGGIIVGRAELLKRAERHPLARAVRIDKMTLSALEATLQIYRDGVERVFEEIPIWRALSNPQELLYRRANSLLSELSHNSDWSFQIVEGRAAIGGGALPTAYIPSVRIAIRSEKTSPEEIEQSFRRRFPPIIGIIEEGSFLLDLRTVREDEYSSLKSALLELVSSSP